MTAARLESRQWKIAAIAAAAVLIVLVIVAFSHSEEAVQVWTAPAVYGDLSQEVTTNGTVIPTKEFQARANFPGIIEKLFVELGAKVKPGQMLVSMRDPFATARLATAGSALQAARLGNENTLKGGSQEERIALTGDLQHAQQTQTEAAKALAALKQLQQKGAASTAEVAAAEERLRSANTTVETLRERSTHRFSQADLRSATAHVEDAQEALNSAKIQFANANISSPMAGTVYAVQVSAYDFVPMGGDLLRVANLQSVEIRAYFDEPEIGKLQAGQPVRIDWNGRPDRRWHGHIKQAPVAAMALGPRSVGECIITVDDSKEDLLPNTNVMATVTIQRHHHVLTVPRAALRTDGPANYVFRVVDGKLQRTPVTPGIINLESVEIAQGLAPNDVVALNAVDNRNLQDGLPIRIGKPGAAPGGLIQLLRTRIVGLGQR
jgi:HlyD family secretion protein